MARRREAKRRRDDGPDQTGGSHMEAEQGRLEEARSRHVAWKKWGPYLSDRQWGTVREDYSDNGDAWNFFTHDHARSRAYRWGEDGLCGISDDKQRLCFALALWNGRDPLLKERLFGLTNSEGNHGEDVKEYYFYLDSTPTHSYMKFLYKYPQAAFPYSDLVETNRRRSRTEFEYELLDTGVFNDNRYFDVFVEYAKESPEDILIKITACNRGPEEAELHLLPTLWFRNDWASWITNSSPKPLLKQVDGPAGASAIAATHVVRGDYYLYCEGEAPLLFTENSTNHAKLHLDYPDIGPYVKDGGVPVACGSFGNLKNRVKYPHFSTYTREFCHGLPSLFLPLGAGRPGVAVPHAPVGVAQRLRHRVPNDTRPHPPTAKAPPRAHTVCGIHPEAALRRLCARPRPPPARSLSTAPAPRAHAGAPPPGGHLDALLPAPGLCLSGLGRLGPSPRPWPSPWGPLAATAVRPLSPLCSRD